MTFDSLWWNLPFGNLALPWFIFKLGRTGPWHHVVKFFRSIVQHTAFIACPLVSFIGIHFGSTNSAFASAPYAWKTVWGLCWYRYNWNTLIFERKHITVTWNSKAFLPPDLPCSQDYFPERCLLHRLRMISQVASMGKPALFPSSFLLNAPWGTWFLKPTWVSRTSWSTAKLHAFGLRKRVIKACMKSQILQSCNQPVNILFEDAILTSETAVVVGVASDLKQCFSSRVNLLPHWSMPVPTKFQAWCMMISNKNYSIFFSQCYGWKAPGIPIPYYYGLECVML